MDRHEQTARFEDSHALARCENDVYRAARSLEPAEVRRAHALDAAAEDKPGSVNREDTVDQTPAERASLE